MLGQAEFKEIKQTNVGKDIEKTKQRVKEIWSELDKNQRNEIMELSDLKKYTIQRTYTLGNISVKLAAAMAQVLSINPYYLTGASDERNEYSDEIFRQFLTENKYGKFFESGEKKKRQYNRKSPIDSNVSANEAAFEGSVEDAIQTPVTESVIEEEKEAKTPEFIAEIEPSNPLYELLTTRIQEKINAIKQSELEIFESMPPEKADELLKGLLLRSEYSEEAKHLATIVKFLMTI